MGESRSLPVIMPAALNQRWSCHSCGDCCRELVGHLFEADRERIDKQKWADRLGVAPYVRLGRGWALNKRADGACVFLDENGLCKIHAKHGEAAKPLACRIFPFSMRRTHGGWQVSLRFDCPSVTSSTGRPISEYHAWLGELAGQLRKYEKAPVKREGADLNRRVAATREETDEVIRRFTEWIGNEELPITRRLIGASRITTTLGRATLGKVRGSRFAELLDLLFAALPGESAIEPVSPTARQRGMLRQLAFAHSEHVSLAELHRGFLSRAGKRWQQLRRGRRFRAGKGIVPRLPGFDTDVRFDEVESVQAEPEQTGDMCDLLVRFITSRLEGRAVFGGGYYGWPVFTGLTALWLSVAAAGWLGCYVAAAGGRRSTTFDDFARGIRIVDRAATRLPALGALSERARVKYLLNEDGVARLGYSYLPVWAARPG